MDLIMDVNYRDKTLTATCKKNHILTIKISPLYNLYACVF